MGTASTIDELRADLERSTRALERSGKQIESLRAEIAALEAERNDLARQLGEEVAARQSAEAARKHADGLFVQVSADRDRLKHDLEQEKLRGDALALLLDRAADCFQIAIDRLPEDRSARECLAEMRQAAKDGSTRK